MISHLQVCLSAHAGGGEEVVLFRKEVRGAGISCPRQGSFGWDHPERCLLIALFMGYKQRISLTISRIDVHR